MASTAQDMREKRKEEREREKSERDGWGGVEFRSSVCLMSGRGLCRSVFDSKPKKWLITTSPNPLPLGDVFGSTRLTGYVSENPASLECRSGVGTPRL